MRGGSAVADCRIRVRHRWHARPRAARADPYGTGRGWGSPCGAHGASSGSSRSPRWRAWPCARGGPPARACAAARRELQCVGCLAHARRKLFEQREHVETKEALASSARSTPSSTTRKQGRSSAPPRTWSLAHSARDLFAKLLRWGRRHRHSFEPRSGMGRAIRYLLRNYDLGVSSADSGRGGVAGSACHPRARALTPLCHHPAGQQRRRGRAPSRRPRPQDVSLRQR